MKTMSTEGGLPVGKFKAQTRQAAIGDNLWVSVDLPF